MVGIPLLDPAVQNKYTTILVVYSVFSIVLYGLAYKASESDWRNATTCEGPRQPGNSRDLDLFF
jgi:hypothetical protein